MPTWIAVNKLNDSYEDDLVSFDNKNVITLRFQKKMLKRDKQKSIGWIKTGSVEKDGEMLAV